LPKISAWKIRRKQQKAQQRKTRGMLFVEVLLLSTLALLVVYIPPSYVTIFLVMGLIFGIVSIPVYSKTKNIRRSIFLGLLVVGVAGLRALESGSLFNVGLLVSALLVFEYYCIKTGDSSH